MKTLNQPQQQSTTTSNNAMTNNMINGAFVLKMKTPSWRLCVVKQTPDEPASSWMLFGQHKTKKSKFQMEFKTYQERMLINHLVKLAISDHDHDDNDTDYAKLRLVLVAESPAISCIESLWSLNGIEMYRSPRLHTPNYLYEALHQDVNMLCTSPQISQPQQPQPQPQPQHPMQTRSRKH
jgi:hypothetical protein